MTLKLCKRCSTMKNIRGNKIMCKRCEEEFSDKSVWKCVCDKEVLNKYKSEPGSLQEEMRQDIIKSKKRLKSMKERHKKLFQVPSEEFEAEEEIKTKIMKEVFGDELDYNKFMEAIKELRYEVDRESECQDIIDFIEKLMNKVRDNFKIAIDKSFEAGQNSVPRFKQHLKAEGLNS